jgi:Putative Actinobacterial Holin-X, holin superfamily III
MTSTTESIRSLIDKSKDYLETQLELTKLKTIDKSSDVLSTAIVFVFMAFLGVLVLMFVSIAVALLIGESMGSYHSGFFIVGGFYALLLLIIFLQRDKWIKNPIANSLIGKMMK